MIDLVVSSGNQRDLFVVMNAVVVGRDPSCDVAFPDDWTVSRRHAVITRVGDALFVTDCGSRNGTYVNGKRVNGANLLPTPSVLRLGARELGVRYEPSARRPDTIVDGDPQPAAVGPTTPR